MASKKVKGQKLNYSEFVTSTGGVNTQDDLPTAPSGSPPSRLPTITQHLPFLSPLTSLLCPPLSLVSLPKNVLVAADGTSSALTPRAVAATAVAIAATTRRAAVASTVTRTPPPVLTRPPHGAAPPTPSPPEAAAAAATTVTAPPPPLTATLSAEAIGAGTGPTGAGETGAAEGSAAGRRVRVKATGTWAPSAIASCPHPAEKRPRRARALTPALELTRRASGAVPLEGTMTAAGAEAAGEVTVAEAVMAVAGAATVAVTRTLSGGGTL